MEKVVYNEDVISEFPTGSSMYNQFQDLKDELDHMESERDILLSLLHEISNAEDPEELEEVLLRVKEFTDNSECPQIY